LSLSPILPVTAALLILLILVAAFLSLRKRSRSRDFRLINHTGVVESPLSPEGTIIVDGEVWRARSQDGIPIGAKTQVEVIGTRDHLIVVKRK
jgi:membrane protein implicated in regulation of membrane protease activity